MFNDYSSSYTELRQKSKQTTIICLTTLLEGYKIVNKIKPRYLYELFNLKKYNIYWEMITLLYHLSILHSGTPPWTSDSMLDHISLHPVFESRCGHIWRFFIFYFALLPLECFRPMGTKVVVNTNHHHHYNTIHQGKKSIRYVTCWVMS